MKSGQTRGNSKPINYIAAVDGDTFAVRIAADGAITLNDEPCPANLQSVEGASVYSLLLGSQSYEVLVEQAGDEYTITLDGDRFTVRVADERYARSSQGQTYGQRGAAPGGAAGRQAAEQGAVISPMTGVLIEVLVQEGQTVEAGDRVAILEAMKTENVIRASQGGTVRDIQVTAGQTLRMDAIILYIDGPQS